MNDKIYKNIKLTELIGNKKAISSDKGQILFNILEKHLTDGEIVELDFSEIELLLTVFLNIGIGQLFSKFSHQFIEEHLIFAHIVEDDKTTLDKVISRAKDYFKDKAGFDNLAKNTL